MSLDHADRRLARKRAVHNALSQFDPLLVDAYIRDFPTLDADGFPIEEDPFMDEVTDLWAHPTCFVR